MPGNYPEAPLSGKAYNTEDLVQYSEDVYLDYPKDEAEFATLRRKDLDFDPSRVGTRGTPLRYPANPVELRLSDLLRKG